MIVLHVAIDLREGSADLVKNVIMTPIAELLRDYSTSQPELKEPEILQLFAKAFEKLATSVHERVPEIIRVVLESTVPMISTDFNSYPDHRKYFFEFIRAAVTYEFVALFNMPGDQFKLLIDCAVWAARHTLTDLQDLGLDVLVFILEVHL